MIDNKDSVRSFVAVVPDDGLKEALVAEQEQLARKVRGVTWVRRDNLHLTLQFLGEVERARISELSAKLSSVSESVPPFRVTTAGLGTFPAEATRTRVVWAGVIEGASDLGELADRIGRCARESRIPVDDRPYSAHLTLGRVRRRLDLESARALAFSIERSAGRRLGSSDVERICLMASVLKPSGSVYRILESFPLTGPREG